MTTLRRTADLVGQTYTLTCKDRATGALITPTGTPTAQMYTDAARTTGLVNLAVAPTAQPQVFTVALPVTPVGQRWLKHVIPTASGSQADADDDIQFDAVTGEVDATIATLDEVKAQLNARTTVDDAEIQRYMIEITSAFERVYGPILPTSVTEVHNESGRRVPAVVLRNPAVVSITSVTESSGGAQTVLVEHVWGGNEADAYSRDGNILTRYADGAPAAFRQPVRVVYIAGFSPVPGEITRLFKREVQLAYHAEQFGTVRDDESAAPRIPGTLHPGTAKALRRLRRPRIR